MKLPEREGKTKSMVSTVVMDPAAVPLPPMNGQDTRGAVSTQPSHLPTVLTHRQEMELRDITSKLTQPKKGILAADETNDGMAARLRSIGLENTGDNRRRYRQMLFTTPNLSKHISGVILYDETYRQATDKGERLVDVLRRQSVVVGIQVDRGLVPLEGSAYGNIETATQGMENLAQRVAEYKRGGCGFAKWRCAYHIGDGMPSQLALVENANLLARYASVCQRHGLVPIVEPDVVADGQHSIDDCQRVSERVLAYTYKALAEHNVLLEATLLKTNMVTSGLDAKVQATPEEVAAATMKTVMRTVPPAVPGIAFLSGGQSELTATANLNAINSLANKLLPGERKPWQLTFCFGRALQAPVAEIWRGSAENVSAAQKAFVHRARANADAEEGKYEGEKAVSAALGAYFVRGPQRYY